MNEVARRSKAGGIACFIALPAALTIYFIAIYVGAANGAEWALNNDTYVHMNSWFHGRRLVVVFGRRVAVRRLVECAERNCRSVQYFLHDRLVGNLLIEKQAGYAVAGYDLGLCPSLRRMELRVHLPEPADPFLVLRPGTSAGTDLCGGAVEQGRLDSEPGQHSGTLVHVRTGISAVPGCQPIHHRHFGVR